MKHYITKYKNKYDELIIVSWLQINIFGLCYCFSKKELVIPKND